MIDTIIVEGKDIDSFTLEPLREKFREIFNKEFDIVIDRIGERCCFVSWREQLK